jgi:hypothetical protein
MGRHDRKVRYSIGWYGREARAGVFNTPRRPDGEILRVMDKHLFTRSNGRSEAGAQPEWPHTKLEEPSCV